MDIKISSPLLPINLFIKLVEPEPNLPVNARTDAFAVETGIVIGDTAIRIGNATIFLVSVPTPLAIGLITLPVPFAILPIADNCFSRGTMFLIASAILSICLYTACI